ncbi:vegetative incompatibility het-e [Fusarium globosum]|uniref:Vegetative incompatibility het-e n=1 Tax=Fusarium globosum TaxID=78864 RepID=A0A8H5XN08_9HYPO|nr:vegetative incompatibility het-e [Fusarium globosum]
MRTRLKSPDLYAIGWIAALPIERAAATALLHDRHDVPESFDQHRSDTNSYTWGRIGEHNVVIASLPAVELLGYVPVGSWKRRRRSPKLFNHVVERRIGSLSIPIHSLDHRTALNQLPIAEGASFDSKAEEHSPICLPDTRQELLEDIDRWINDPNSKTRGDLGASFFFKTGEADRGNLNKLMSTLAHQLALSIPGVAFFTKKTLDASPAIVGKSVKEQFEKLIQEPLSEAAATATVPSSVVMVIDALDECDQEADIRLLINIFSQAKTLRSHFRVFLTSRPELPIRLGFSEVQGSYQNLVLHEIPVQIVEHDIVVFLNDEFKKIRYDFNMTVGDERKLPPDWPGRPTVQSLAQMAVPLFIFAATVCRFVDDRKRDSPPIQLRKVLDYERKGHVSQLDLTYGPVLRSLITDVSENDKTQIINDFKMIVGSIVMLADPLSVWALSQLLEVDPEYTTETESACAATAFVISRLSHHTGRRFPGRRKTYSPNLSETLLARHAERFA